MQHQHQSQTLKPLLSVTNAQIQAMINEGVTAALAARDATRNGDDSHTSGTGARRPVQVARECTYPDFLKCQPLNFKGTEEFSDSLSGRDYKNPLNVNTGANQKVCFECGAQGHFKKDCPKLKNNNNRGNQVGNAKTQAKVYAVGNAGVNPDNNVITGTFLLNNRYASILFDTGADRSFVSTAFSSQIVITPTALDHDYNVELADGRIVGLNTIIRGWYNSSVHSELTVSIHIDPAKIEFYQKIAKSMTKLTRKGVKFDGAINKKAAVSTGEAEACAVHPTWP
ncbi:putative reverse transcriptase domain-containing protein [Tanacetum coccineum]